MPRPTRFRPLWLLLLLLLAFPTSIVQGAPPSIKIAPALRDRLAAGGRADFVVRFAEQADLAPALAMDWHDRGWFVYETLRATAARSQARAIDAVKARRLDYETLIVNNALYVRAGDLPAANALAALPEVAAVTAPQTYYVDPPIVGAAPALPAALEWGVIDVKADQFWSAFGLQGEGSVVANIGTGVAYQHPALDQAYKCGAGPDHDPCWYDPTNTCPTAPCDDNGHGTAMMGLMVADDDPALPYQAGVAPGAQWIACKGCAGSSCPEYTLMLCAGWLLAPDDDPANRPSAVHNSWGSAGCNPWFQSPVQAWVASGIFPAFPPGGSGPGCGTIASPADYQEVFAGTAHDTSRVIASFAGRGPSCYGHNPYTKPNISAPGVNLRVAFPPDTWQIWSGASLSAAFPPGVVALLWSCAPQLRGDVYATFEALQNTADTPPPGDCGAPPPPYGGNYTYGYGYLNALAAGLAYCAQGPGLLHGHVYAAGTGDPIAGAAVTAEPGPVQDLTDAQGYYSMTLDAGAYTVTAAAAGYGAASVVVNVQAGLTTTRDFSLTLLSAPLAAFSAASPVCLGEAMPFTDESTANPPVDAWWWEFGDGGTSTEQHPLYTYSSAGPYQVLLVVTNTVGADEVTGTVAVLPLPEASFLYAPVSGLLPLTVYFTDTSLYAENPTWDFGDGGAAAGGLVSHTYAATGTYTVQLTVDSPTGCGSDTAAAEVHVYFAGPPVAGFTADPWSGFAPLAVQFTDESTGTPPITSWTWAFGDGGVSTATNPLYTFALTGTWDVVLTVANVSGTAAVTRPVAVWPLPEAHFAQDTAMGEVPLVVHFTNTSRYAISPTWSFGDGSPPAHGDHVSHTYVATGTFPVVLTVTSPYSGSVAAAAAGTVTAYAPGACVPVRIAAVNQRPAGCAVTLSAALTGDPPFTYTWDLGAFGVFYIPTPTVDFMVTGTYTGALEVWNCAAGHDAAAFTVTVACEPASFRIYLPLVRRQ